MTDLKTCSTCGITESAELFRVNRFQCLGCRRARDRARYKADPERFKAAVKANRLAKLEQYRAMDRKYAAENAARKAQAAREWRRADPQRASQSEKASRQRHYEAFQIRRNKHKTLYRARMAGVQAEPVNLEMIWQASDKTCGICHLTVARSDRAFDHIKPISLGGVHTIENIQVAHDICNKRKGNKYPYPPLAAPSPRAGEKG